MSAAMRTSLHISTRRTLRYGRPHARCFSVSVSTRQSFERFIKISEEVQSAIAAKKPVVALESAIYTHGYPYPDNHELAKDMEQTIRDNGAVPATICILDGIARIGLSQDQIKQMSEAVGKPKLSKASRRDLAFLAGIAHANPDNGYVGGTTIAGTMALAKLAGIKVFATGGLGGVHRGAERTMDISADLTELGRTNVAVISSGAKAFLDLEKTLEYLETQGVYVGTFGDRKNKVELPAFFSHGSGIPSPSVVESAKEAAAIIYASHAMGLTSGQFFANPIPKADEIPHEELKDIIDVAVREGDKHTKGKDITPYVLNEIKKATAGRTVHANRVLVLNNAKMGANVAVELAKLEGSEIEPTSVYPGINRPRPTKQIVEPKPESDAVDVIVVGGVAVDVSCDVLSPRGSSGTVSPAINTSNRSKIVDTLGGVANNVAYAAHLSGARTRLVSAIGADVSGKWVLEQLSKRGMDISGISVEDSCSTARYVSVNDSDGQLHLACADMVVIESMSPEVIISQIQRSEAKWACIDGNLSPSTISTILTYCGENQVNVFFEPTSMSKATTIFASKRVLDVYPNASLYAAAPNTYELDAMYENAAELNLFDTDMPWWDVMDALGLDSRFRDDLANVSRASGLDLLSSGILQKAIQLSPYIPSLFVKLGAHGCLVIRIVEPGNSALSTRGGKTTVMAKARDGSGIGGIWIKHIPAELVPKENLVSVNGAGDTFLGALMARMAMGKADDLQNAVDWAQRAAVLTLGSKEAVCTKIRTMSR